MIKTLMLGAAISALMISGAFAQSSAPPSSSGQTKPPAAAATKPDAIAPAAKIDRQPAAKPEGSTANSGDKAKADNKTTADTGGKSAGSEPKIVASQKPDEFLASNFKGTDVIGSSGKKIGDVSDILFEKDGTIKAYVVSFGGFLGMGAKEVAIAPSAFQVMPAKNGGAKKLRLSMSQRDLKSAQKFTEYTPPKPVTTTGAGGMSPSPMGAAPHSSRGTTPTGR